MTLKETIALDERKRTKLWAEIDALLYNSEISTQELEYMIDFMKQLLEGKL